MECTCNVSCRGLVANAMTDNLYHYIERRHALRLAVRGAPTAARVLIPVWGYEFVRKFLDRSLPTLLAPGNLPAIAAVLPTEFIFLTSEHDKTHIREHPAYGRLATVCAVRFHEIDDLVMRGNHSTTLTLAYAREIKRSGPSALDTCFFFLVSDYLMADGSLAAVLARMQAGASAVQVGNFQTVEDEGGEWLDRHLAAGAGAVALPARELMRWALTCTHPATIANTVNNPVCHNNHTNRLFWRVDDNTLIGRFYLMHMICIRPEITDFVIGASCDYSFVPEMCASGNVVTIGDSDEYLAVEVQPRDHEARFITWGPVRPRDVAISLSEWTTARHRLNVHDTIVYHADELPASLSCVMDEATRFISKVSKGLSPTPQPHRDHPYWRGAIAALEAAKHASLVAEGELAMAGRSRRSIASRLSEAVPIVCGRPPEVKRGHPRWADFSRHRAAIEAAIAEIGPRLLIASTSGTVFTDWVAKRVPQAVRIPLHRLLQRFRAGGTFPERLDGCVLELHEADFAAAGEIVDSLVPSLRPGAPVFVVAYNPRWSDRPAVFGDVLYTKAPLFWRSGLWPEDMLIVSASRLRWWLNATFIRAGGALLRGAVLLIPLRAMLASVFGVLALGANLVSSLRPSRSIDHGVVSSFLMRLRLSAPGPEIPGRIKSRAQDGEHAEQPTKPPIGIGGWTNEPQDVRPLKVSEEVCVRPLEVMTDQAWREDPRLLSFILARYKFVAKMLSGRSNIAEVGGGDAFGTRIVLQETQNLIVYDSDPILIEDVEQRGDPPWLIKARHHDILKAPLPTLHNAIYSLNLIEHIPVTQEGRLLRHLCDSISDKGVLIIGTPSLESQSYASPQSKIDNINCKSGRTLKALLKEYFHTVFIFSMNDEIVHTGFHPMAHYLFAVCCEPKR
jgi:hypothetical protein